MFVDLPSTPEFDEHAWQMSFEERIASLFPGRRRVVWIYGTLDTSTFRYRAINMLQALVDSNRDAIAATWFSHEEIERLMPFIDQIDAFVLARVQYSGMVETLIGRARKTGARILFDCDDLVFDLKYAFMLMRTLNIDTKSEQNLNKWLAYISRIRSTGIECDAAITTNEFLANQMAESLGIRQVHVVPNFLNRQQQEYSEHLFQHKQKSSWLRNEKIHIGYFSGSPSHKHDFAIAAPALARLMEQNPNVSLRLVGYIHAEGPLKQYESRIEWLPFMNFVELQRAISEVEINLAPLQDNTFTNCKSELKYFEAAAVGTWTIASPAYTFRHAIQDGMTGRLAKAHEWDHALHEAVQLINTPDRYASLASEAARSVFKIYDWRYWAEKIELATLGTRH